MIGRWYRRLASRPVQDEAPPPLTETCTAAAPLHPKLATNMAILATAYGQLATFDSHRPSDAEGNPIPWFTYPAIEYLNRFDCAGWRIFEYGCGHSTLYWTRRGALVTSVEHDEAWFREMQQRNLPNATLMHRTEPQTYAAAIGDSRQAYDVIVIDGVWRESCAEVCLPYLTEDGFLVLDNADWYHETAARIRDSGFLEVSFSGFGPVNDYTWTTSVFVRAQASRRNLLKPPDPIGGNPLGPDARDHWW